MFFCIKARIIVLLMILFFLSVFFFGLVVGSFLNVVILRYNTGKSFIGGRSYCFSCGHNLKWFELLPLVSFIFLKGRCSHCKTRISWQYPLVEFLTGFVFCSILFLSLKVGVFIVPISILFDLMVWAVLIASCVYDLRHMIIPDAFSLLFVLLVVSKYLVLINLGIISVGFFYSLFISGCVLFLLFFFLWVVSSGRWIGLGDVKLVFGLGLYLGLPQGFSALAFAFWSGALYAVGRLFLQKYASNQLSANQKTVTMKSEVPFGPFLVLGTFLAYLLSADIFHISTFFL